MCLAAIAVEACESFPLVVAANRDESHLRPTAAAGWWEEPPGILGGRDLEAGGSWLAVDRHGRLAAVTNQPAPRGETFADSRGHLVSEYLDSRRTPDSFCNERASASSHYGPYNLLLFDGGEFFYSTNRSPAQRLAGGVHVLSNAPLGTAWPKVEFAADRLKSILRDQPAPGDLTRRLFEMLENREELGAGEAGESLHWRTRRVFALDDRYGTRSSAVVLMARNGDVQFFERRFRADGRQEGESAYRFRRAPGGEPQANR